MKAGRKKIRTLVVDDHNLVRAGIIALLSDQHDIEVVAQAANGEEAIRKAAEVSPDVVLMDISMPVMDGIKAAEVVLKKCPGAKILMLTQYDQREYVKSVMHSGVSGYILKSSLTEDLTAAIRAVHRGKKFIAPRVSELMADEFFNHSENRPLANGPKRLTNREQEILQLVVEGSSNLDISKKLAISVRTVEFHRTNIMAKLGIHDIPHLVKYAILNNLIDLST